MSRQPRSSATAPSVVGRQNEYFVPRDGIDREVISADICRYLGNDALVRPGQYENPQTGQVVAGYYINAYRNLTTAMIDDLKADSARWESERRAQTSRNTPGGQYRQSETHQTRQQYGPSEANYTPDPYAGNVASQYPGSGAPGYNGAAGSYAQPRGFSGSNPGGYQYNQSPPPSANSGYPPSAQPLGGMRPPSGFASGQEPPYIATGANNHNAYDQRGGNYPSGNMPHQPVTTAAPSGGYVPAYSPYTYPASGGMPSNEGFYGRGQNPPPPQGNYQQQAQPQQQYDETPSPRASSSSQLKAQTPPAGLNNRRNDRDSDRHPSDRHGNRPPRR